MVPFRSKTVTLSMKTCRSTQAKIYTGLIPSTGLWPQEMFTFLECLHWSCLNAVSMPTFVTGSLWGSTATSALVELLRHLHDGDPMEIEKNSRWSSDRCLLVTSMSTGITRGDVCAKEEKSCVLCPLLPTSTVCRDGSGLFHADSLLTKERKKRTALVAFAVSGKDNRNSSERLTFFSVVAACLLNGLMIIKYHWTTAFYCSNLQDFQNFPGVLPRIPLGGLTAPPPPQDPQLF